MRTSCRRCRPRRRRCVPGRCTRPAPAALHGHGFGLCSPVLDLGAAAAASTVREPRIADPAIGRRRWVMSVLSRRQGCRAVGDRPCADAARRWPPHRRPPDETGFEDLARRADGDEGAFVQHPDAVARGGGEVEVVQDEQDGDAGLADQGQQADLVADVEVVGGFVQDQHAGLLDEAAGHEHPLAFTAGQGKHPPVGEVGHVHALHRVPAQVAFRGPAPGPPSGAGCGRARRSPRR